MWGFGLRVSLGFRAALGKGSGWWSCGTDFNEVGVESLSGGCRTPSASSGQGFVAVIAKGRVDLTFVSCLLK